MRNSRSLALISCLLLIAHAALGAELSGKVTFRGAPLVGAVVSANLIGDRRPNAVIVTRTGTGGTYMLRLRNGDYIVLVDMEGRRVYQGRVAITGPNVTKHIDLR